MSVAITAVPAVASDVQAAPEVSNDVQAAPAAGAHIEQTLSDFVAQMQGNPLGDAAHLANPAALASELVGSLRGYLESARSLQMATRVSAADTQQGGGIETAPRTPAGAAERPLHGGPARERLEPADRHGSGVTASDGVNLDQIRRTMDVALQSMSFTAETTLVVHGSGQVSHSTNTLLKGQ
jgi:hypothetical protein